IILGGCHERLADPDYLASRNVRIWMGGHQAFAAAVQAVYDTLSDVHAGRMPSEMHDLASPDLMAVLTRTDYFEVKTARYLGAPD
ncbi:MAG: hypothetical protein ABIP08_05095, partial [Lautropia sp.]